MLNKDKFNWLKQSVKRDRRHEPLIDKLTTANDGYPAIFPYIKELMIFAAMIGYSKNKRVSLQPKGIGILLETYATTREDTYIYLLALMTEKNSLILKNDNLPAAISIFEEYCNAGLDIIQLWLDENPGDITGVETLSNKIFEQAIANERAGMTHIEPEELAVEF